MKNELLPMGSVVLLKEGTKKIVIMGIFPFDMTKNNRIFDYLGVPYPEGYMGMQNACLFNHENIAEVIFRGYEDEERKNMMKFLDKINENAADNMNKK